MRQSTWGPTCPIFNELSSGDIVTVRYFDSYIVAVTPGERMKPIENTTAEAQEATVTQPDGTVLPAVAAGRDD